MGIGGCYLNGIAISKDEKKALEWYLKSARNENTDGQLNVGMCYQNGIGVSKNEKKAFEWYLKSAKGGNSKGQLNVGNCYQNGTGIPKDERKAFESYLKSAEDGNFDGQLRVGNCYKDGIGIPRDEEKASEWFLKSTRDDNAENCNRNNIGIFKASLTPVTFNKEGIKKKPFSNVQSISGQNKRLAAFGKDSGKKLSELIKHHQLVSENEQP